jgi:hypothetical protein
MVDVGDDREVADVRLVGDAEKVRAVTELVAGSDE